MAQLVRAPALRSGEPGSNLGAGENFSLELLTYDLIKVIPTLVFTSIMDRWHWRFPEGNGDLIREEF